MAGRERDATRLARFSAHLGRERENEQNHTGPKDADYSHGSAAKHDKIRRPTKLLFSLHPSTLASPSMVADGAVLTVKHWHRQMGPR